MYSVLGLMSGTSLDGVDVAFLKTNGARHIDLGPGHTYPYPDALQQRLRAILGNWDLSPTVLELEQELTEFHSTVVKHFIQTHNLTVDLLGFHGQTIAHQPRYGGLRATTRQLGNGPLLAKATGIDVVYQFRINDVAQGGEGAPLVPIFHEQLFPELPVPKVIINIGGVSNVTWIHQGQLLSGDVGPGNALVNDWVYAHTGEAFDPEGRYAQEGRLHTQYIEAFFKNPFFQKPLPKSLDRDSFSIPFKKGELSLEDGARTLAEITVEGIVRSPLPSPPHTWILAGGGAHNQFLRQRLKERLEAPFYIATDLGVSGDFLEAYAFGYLAARSREGLPLSYPTTTGVPFPCPGGLYAKAHR